MSTYRATVKEKLMRKNRLYCANSKPVRFKLSDAEKLYTKITNKLHAKNCPSRKDEEGILLVDTLLGSALVVLSGIAALTLINAANDGMVKMNLASRIGLAQAAQMEKIREAAFKLHCLSGYGCDDASATKNIKYDESKLADDCANQSFGQSLLTELEGNNLTSDFNLQTFDSSSPSIIIELDLTASGNTLVVSMNEPASKQCIEYNCP